MTEQFDDKTSASIDEEMREMFEGNFLHSDDIMASGPITVIISGVTAQNKEKDAKGKLINRPILAFKGGKKRLIIGKLNTSIMGILHGKKPSKWIGKPITLVVKYLREAFGQRNVPTIRLATTDDKPLPFRLRAWYGADNPWESVANPRKKKESTNEGETASPGTSENGSGSSQGEGG